MKIAILSDDFPPKSAGGSGIVAFHQAQGLASRGHEVIVITTTDNKADQGVHLQEGLRVHSLYTRYNPHSRIFFSSCNNEIISSVQKIITDFRPDVVHAHNVHQRLSYQTLTVAKKHAPKVILTLHDAMSVHYSKIFPKISIDITRRQVFDYRLSPLHQVRYFWRVWSPTRNYVIRKYLKNADVILAVSSALADALKQNGVAVTGVLHNGIDVNTMVVQEKEISEFKLKHNLLNKRVLFFGGRLSRAKGGDVALDLMIKLEKSFPDICLLIAGQKDGYTDRLKNKAKEAGVLSSIQFAGWLNRDEIPLAYKVSDIVLVLSLYLDPFPTINLEAMASSKPVLGTCFGGTPETVVDGLTGYIVDPHKENDLLEKANKLLKNEDLRERMGKAAFERVTDDFSLTGQLDTLEAIYAGK